MERLNFEVIGSEEKPALVLIHGFMSSNLQWALNRDRLCEHFRLVGVELWGHGKSPTPRDPARYRVDHYVAELERIRGELGLARWGVCGQSFGAGIAIRYALAHPEFVSGLVVTNSRSAFNDVSREVEEAGGFDAWQSLDVRALPFHPRHAKRFPAELKSQMEAAADAIPTYALWQATATTLRDLSCRQLAADLLVPLLLVNGRYEKSFQNDRDYAVAAIPYIEVADLAAGHSVNIEAPLPFERAVVEFAARHP